MGLEEAERVADAHPDIDACFIYTDEEGKLQTFLTKGMEKYMKSVSYTHLWGIGRISGKSPFICTGYEV